MEVRIDVSASDDPGTGADLTAEVDLTAPAQRVDLHDPAQRLAVEGAIGAIPGVMGARLVAGFDRQVDELHVLTTLDRSPKQTVRDVQTVLMARFGVPTDHRVVSVVQLDESEVLAPSSRVRIEQISLTQAGTTMTAEVTVREGDERYRGSGEGAASPTGRVRAVALATLAAIEHLLEETGAIELEGVETVTVLGREVAVALLTVHMARHELTLSGSAIIRDTPQDAIARSVLDALNRMMAEAGH